MWIFLNNSFLSIVKPANSQAGDDVLLVRARMKGDIEAVFPDAKVFSLAGRDYQFRSFIHKHIVADALADAATNLSYPNFKDSIPNKRYHDACSAVWGIMSRLQPVPPYSNRLSPQGKLL